MSAAVEARSDVATSDQPFVVLHIGDLHLTDRRRDNARDLATILDQIAGFAPRGAFDFIYLPGDIAEDGTAEQYAILHEALARHPALPIRLIPGDHDRQHGSMDAFGALFSALSDGPAGHRHAPVINPLPRPEAMREVPQYYHAETFSGVRCLFLDVVSAGFGRKGIGLDFRLGRAQHRWLSAQLAEAAEDGTPCAIFTHVYPADLREPDEQRDIAGLFWIGRVRLVEMGHTHYNELAHDGRTLYAAARSVGQNEDGSVGYAVAAIDGPVTSWRFRALDRTAPFVLITSPADRRLATQPLVAEGTGMVRDAAGRIRVRALVLSDREPAACRCRADFGGWIPMVRRSDRTYEAWLPWPDGSVTLKVEATDERWPGHGPDHIDTDEIEPADPMRGSQGECRFPDRAGSDAFRIERWLHKGVRGDQLGPNRAGRKW